MPRTTIAKPLEVVLELESIRGNHIDNVQNWYVFTAAEIANYEAHYKEKFPRIIVRTSGCTDVYNCHGMVFAARRTKIWDSTVIQSILRDDGYRKVTPDEALPGDIVLYVHSSGDISHSGLVLDTETPLPGIHRVVSKWGPWCEVIHYATDCPHAQEPDITIEYYRLY